MKELISIIVPVYNVENYLERCIQSIMNQTYKDLEIIIVDDGSTDGSGRLCDEYGSRDDRIVVVHKQNGGLSSARNAGLDAAKGRYIGFVDSDDYIAIDMYECLIKHMKSDIDVVGCGIVQALPDKKGKMYCLNALQRFSNLQAIEGLLTEKIGFSVCTKLYRKELFDNIRFPEGKTSEDIPTTYAVVKNSRNLVHIGQGKYYYVYRRNSIDNREFYKGRVASVLFARDVLNDVKINYPGLTEQAEALYILNTIRVMRSISRSLNSSQFSDIETRLKKMIFRMLPRILCNSYIDKDNRKYIFNTLFKKTWA